MRISDWSSDVCSSDLPGNHRLFALEDIIAVKREYTVGRPGDVDDLDTLGRQPAKPAAVEDCDLRIARGRTIHHQTIRAGCIPAKHGLDLQRAAIAGIIARHRPLADSAASRRDHACSSEEPRGGKR